METTDGKVRSRSTLSSAMLCVYRCRTSGARPGGQARDEQPPRHLALRELEAQRVQVEVERPEHREPAPHERRRS